jgi:hypothetical protein
MAALYIAPILIPALALPVRLNRKPFLPRRLIIKLLNQSFHQSLLAVRHLIITLFLEFNINVSKYIVGASSMAPSFFLPGYRPKVRGSR